MTMNLLLVEDEPLLLEMLNNAVAEVLPQAVRNAYCNAQEALQYAEVNQIDVAFLDINLGVMDGLDMAKKLQELYPRVNIIFCTGYSEYALEAYKIYASAYLTKPIFPEDIEEAMQHLRFPVEEKKRVKIHCFGNFAVYCDGEVIPFKMKRTKELFAYLVDRNGAECTAQELIAVLFEDEQKRSYYNQLRGDLIQTFENLGIGECLKVSRGSLAIVRDAVECDYYDYLDGKRSVPPCEYMTQYSFGEVTLSGLL